ncbi:12082_t:CDS:2, partial [Gigaspora margarita]
ALKASAWSLFTNAIPLRPCRPSLTVRTYLAGYRIPAIFRRQCLSTLSPNIPVFPIETRIEHGQRPLLQRPEAQWEEGFQ